jgi:hypothetical protein
MHKSNSYCGKQIEKYRWSEGIGHGLFELDILEDAALRDTL